MDVAGFCAPAGPACDLLDLVFFEFPNFSVLLLLLKVHKNYLFDVEVESHADGVGGYQVGQFVVVEGLGLCFPALWRQFPIDDSCAVLVVFALSGCLFVLFS